MSGVTGGTGSYTTPLPFNVSFSGLTFILGTYANVTNNSTAPVQVGQIFSGSSTTGVTIQKIVSGVSTPNLVCKVSSVSAQTLTLR